MIPAVAAAAYVAFQNQSTLDKNAYKSVKGPTITHQGNKWVCNGKIYEKHGQVLTCGNASWVGVQDKDVKGIILRDSIS